PIGRLRISESNGWPCTNAWRSSASGCSTNPGDSEDLVSSVYDYYGATLSGLAANKMEKGKNIVITFNYDLVVEESLRRLNIPITYHLSGPGVEIEPSAQIAALDAFQILKLHGSVNWAQQTDGGVLVCRDYERVRSQKLSTFLVPPTWRKNPSDAL